MEQCKCNLIHNSFCVFFKWVFSKDDCREHVLVLIAGVKLFIFYDITLNLKKTGQAFVEKKVKRASCS